MEDFNEYQKEDKNLTNKHFRHVQHGQYKKRYK